ncbi:hypothetical protein ISD85_03220 [Pseudomonas aeruginosa]|uniref:hypothetical protein n=1 Tax=Pseudomonas aeruginosa TaxID=287 RepID=UPI000FFF4281|nr:hypothetical protein [Pseudomonas aeruginosa]MBX5769586.1 hypothetical protein [Pseudomonas aeruginosa]
MTTPISDERLAEVESQYIGDRSRLDSTVILCGTLADIIDRLRAAEADAKRYRWLCASAWYVGPEPCGDTEAVSWHDHNETKDGVTEAIDKAIAMERTP